MAEAITTLGKILIGDEQRDAIHIAIAPVVAAYILRPGDHVALRDDGLAMPSAEPIGIVDPFLLVNVQPNERFWLFLYPNTITSLRHDWIHPAFENAALSVIGNQTAASRLWLQEYASVFRLSYDALMDSAADWLKHREYHVLRFDTPTEAWSEAHEFWTHYEKVTGTKVEDKEASFFTCSC